MAIDTPLPDGAEQTQQTQKIILLYREAWKKRDLEGVLRLYHPDVEYYDYPSGQVLHLSGLRDFVLSSFPSLDGELLEHTDRIRIDGHTAFIQYRICLQGSNGLVFFRSSEAITVRDNLVWRVNEYANIERIVAGKATAKDDSSALSRLGLSVRQIGVLAHDLEEYFQRQKPYLDPDLSLQQVADSTGYTRNQISHLLNQVMGQSFYSYVNQARIMHLLESVGRANDKAKMHDLAFASGFNSLSAFYKSFRKNVGMTPAAYLKKNSTRARVEDIVQSFR